MSFQKQHEEAGWRIANSTPLANDHRSIAEMTATLQKKIATALSEAEAELIARMMERAEMLPTYPETGPWGGHGEPGYPGDAAIFRAALKAFARENGIPLKAQ